MKSNPIIWCEIYVQDMERAKRFYESVFQMKLEKLESPGMDMWAFPMAMDQVGASGALVQMEGVKSGGSGTIPYFHCDEVAIELERVTFAALTLNPSPRAGEGLPIRLPFSLNGRRGWGMRVIYKGDMLPIELERVVAAGGQIYQPKTSIGQYRFMALIVDTEGNMIGLHMPLKEME